MRAKRIRVGVAQINPVLGDLSKNLALHEEMAERAKGEGINLLVFPELSLTGYFVKDLVPSLALSGQSPFLDRLKRLSHDLSIVVGLVEESSDYRFYNSAFLLEGGEVKHVHRKIYLPTYGMFDERRYFASGSRLQAAQSLWGPLGLLLCEDLWHPSAPYLLSLEGMDLLIGLSASPGRGLGAEEKLESVKVWESLNYTYAHLFSCFVIFANRVGYEDGVHFWGGSEVLSPAGSLLAKAKYHKEEFLIAELERSELRRERSTSPLLRDERSGLVLRELKRILAERNR
ncbi:MAG: nitrilase-related carbon-nitrogen hydrolase [candidate division NC10 bacterium]|nr:nitrilase-related carbon-nitrogen hydrolase [candidate division NC10 bacterium]